MYTTIIHPIRKALNLSCNEYVVLDTIYQLSNNEKYNGWCVASKKQLAQWLDLSSRTVERAVATLLAKNLLKRGEKGLLRSTDEYNEQIANKHDWIIGFKGKESQYVSGKTSPRQVGGDTAISAVSTPPFRRGHTAISAVNNNKYNNNDNINVNVKEKFEKLTEGEKAELYKECDLFKERLQRKPSKTEYKRKIDKIIAKRYE